VCSSDLNPVLNAAVILLAPLAMLFAVFRPLSRRDLLLLWAAFFLVAFMTGGAVTVFFTLSGPSPLKDPSRGAVQLIAACFLLYLLLGLLYPHLEEKKWQKAGRMTLLISWRGREKEVPAFLDTGNRLKDPFFRLPVIVIDYRSLEGMLPPAVYRRLSDLSAEAWTALPELEDLSLARCFTLVPFRGVGSRREIMLGLRPDDVVISRGAQSWRCGPRAILGLARHSFGAAAEYQALLPPELVQAG